MSLSAKRDSKGAGCRSLEHTSEASSTPKEHAPVDPWSERQADKEEGFSNLPRKRSSLTNVRGLAQIAYRIHKTCNSLSLLRSIKYDSHFFF